MTTTLLDVAETKPEIETMSDTGAVLPDVQNVEDRYYKEGPNSEESFGDLIIQTVKPEPPDLLGLTYQSDIEIAYRHDDTFQRTVWTNLRKLHKKASYSSEWIESKIINTSRKKFRSHRDMLAEDWNRTDKKLLLLSSWLTYAAIKATGKLKGNDVASGVTAAGVNQQTGNSIIALSAGLMVGLAGARLSAAGMNHTIDQNPATFTKAKELYPKYSSTMKDSYPGFDVYTDEEVEKNTSKNSTINPMKLIGTHTARGLRGMNSITGFLTAAGREGHSSAERSRLANAVSLDAFYVKVGAIGIIGTGIYTVDKISPDIAGQAESVLNNPLFFTGLGMAVAAGMLVANKAKRLKDKINVFANNETESFSR